jgi:hypothetical protein
VKAHVIGGDATKAYADEEESVEEQILRRFHTCQKSVVVSSKETEVTTEHATDKLGTELAVGDLHKVHNEAEFTTPVHIAKTPWAQCRLQQSL